MRPRLDATPPSIPVELGPDGYHRATVRHDGASQLEAEDQLKGVPEEDLGPLGLGVGSMELPPGLIPQAATAVTSVDLAVDVLWNHERVLVGVNARRSEPLPELLRLGNR